MENKANNGTERNGRRRSGYALVAITTSGVIAAIAMIGASRVGELQTENASLANKLEALSLRMNEPDRESPESIGSLIDRVSDSVFVVEVEDDKGHTSFLGTAWTMGERAVATAAHVAIVASDARDKGLTAYVTDPRNEGRRAKITDIFLHPGFEPWARTLNAPLERAGAGGIEELDFVPPCDVAIMKIDLDLGDPLPLASDAELREIRRGQTLVQVGFPMENIPGIPVEQFASIGRLQTMTSPLYDERDDERFLLTYDGVSAGGASGSPVLDTAGRVIGVHTAGTNVIVADLFGSGAKRAPTGFVFAQRIDLLRELMDGKAEENQAARNEKWTEQLGRMTATLAERLDQKIEALADFACDLGETCTTTLLIEDEIVTASPENGGTNLTIKLPGPGRYIIAAGSASFSDVDIAAFAGEEFLAGDAEMTREAVIGIEILDDDEITLSIAQFGLADEAPVRYRVERFES